MSRLRKGKIVEDETSKNNERSSSLHTDPAAQERHKSDFFGVLLRIIFKIFVVLFIGYCVILLVLYTSYSVRHQIVYLNYLVNPFVNYSDPQSRGISNTKNFYIEGQDGRLGVWHIQAKDSSTIDDGKPVVLYMHGNAYSRTAKHRISMYKVLSSLGLHVVAFDYRGFGDSDGYPTEQGLTADGLTTLNWIRDNTKDSSIYLWGHSLGSTVALSVANELNKEKKGALVAGVVLEAPFNNLKEGAVSHPISIMFRFLPNFQEIIQEINYLFKSDEIIKSVTCNILILHDHEDKIINFALGKKLYEAALKGQDENQLIEFKEFHGFGHNFMYQSKELPTILRKFMKLRNEHEE